MIIQIVSDMKFFLLILLMGVFSFTHAFLMLGRNILDFNVTFTSNNNFAQSVGEIWANVVGEFDITDGFQG
jgi:hypothetical protein